MYFISKLTRFSLIWISKAGDGYEEKKRERERILHLTIMFTWILTCVFHLINLNEIRCCLSIDLVFFLLWSRHVPDRLTSRINWSNVAQKDQLRVWGLKESKRKLTGMGLLVEWGRRSVPQDENHFVHFFVHPNGFLKEVCSVTWESRRIEEVNNDDGRVLFVVVVLLFFFRWLRDELLLLLGLIIVIRVVGALTYSIVLLLSLDDSVENER